MVPPWMIEEMEEEERRRERDREPLRMPVERARDHEDERPAAPAQRGVVIVDISPEQDSDPSVLQL